MMKEKITFKKTVGSTKTTNLTNLGIFLCNSCRWEQHTSKLGRDTMMAVNIGRAEQVELKKFSSYLGFVGCALHEKLVFLARLICLVSYSYIC
jgi:hypothetical protein